MTSNDRCAVGADGKLLDANQIDWYNDPDDDAPLPALSVSTTKPTVRAFKLMVIARALTVLHTQGSRQLTLTELAQPATFVAGARRSNRVSKPSRRVLEGVSHSAIGKRKDTHRSPSPSARRRKRVRISCCSSYLHLSSRLHLDLQHRQRRRLR
jgi:hypothetical protein